MKLGNVTIRHLGCGNIVKMRTYNDFFKCPECGQAGWIDCIELEGVVSEARFSRDEISSPHPNCPECGRELTAINSGTYGCLYCLPTPFRKDFPKAYVEGFWKGYNKRSKV